MRTRTRTTDESLAARIHQARRRKGLSRLELAVAMGRVLGHAPEVSTIRNWERGRVRPRLIHLVALAQVLGRPISYFVGEGA